MSRTKKEQGGESSTAELSGGFVRLTPKRSAEKPSDGFKRLSDKQTTEKGPSMGFKRLSGPTTWPSPRFLYRRGWEVLPNGTVKYKRRCQAVLDHHGHQCGNAPRAGCFTCHEHAKREHEYVAMFGTPGMRWEPAWRKKARAEAEACGKVYQDPEWAREAQAVKRIKFSDEDLERMERIRFLEASLKQPPQPPTYRMSTGSFARQLSENQARTMCTRTVLLSADLYSIRCEMVELSSKIKRNRWNKKGKEATTERAALQVEEAQLEKAYNSACSMAGLQNLVADVSFSMPELPKRDVAYFRSQEGGTDKRKGNKKLKSQKRRIKTYEQSELELMTYSQLRRVIAKLGGIKGAHLLGPDERDKLISMILKAQDKIAKQGKPNPKRTGNRGMIKHKKRGNRGKTYKARNSHSLSKAERKSKLADNWQEEVEQLKHIDPVPATTPSEPKRPASFKRITKKPEVSNTTSGFKRLTTTSPAPTMGNGGEFKRITVDQ